MREHYKTFQHYYRLFVIGLFALFIVLGVVVFSRHARAEEAAPSADEHIITLHDDGTDKGFITKKSTLREALKDAGIRLDENDRTEPGLDETLTAGSYQVNIYRARPVLIRDGESETKLVTSYRTAKQIAKQAKIALHDEDKTRLRASSDPISDGVAEVMTITRATEFTFDFYGKTSQAFTQAKTVGDMLKEKKIVMQKNDVVEPRVETPLVKGMKVRLYRNGIQTITEEQDVAFSVEQIKDADKEVGYREIKTPGQKGKRTVTYEVNMQNGKEVSRKEVNSVTTKEPAKQVEIVGTKPNFSGDFAAALAKLRSCEGGYNSWNPAGPYYGAYQFDERTWNSVSSAPYGAATPEEQDAAARKLYERRGWQPWPVCGAARLPDIYR